MVQCHIVVSRNLDSLYTARAYSGSGRVDHLDRQRRRLTGTKAGDPLARVGARSAGRQGPPPWNPHPHGNASERVRATSGHLGAGARSGAGARLSIPPPSAGQGGGAKAAQHTLRAQ